MRQKQYRRVERTEAEPQSPRQTRTYRQRDLGAVARPKNDSPGTAEVVRSEQAQSQDFYGDALLLGCIAVAIFALWMIPVADTRFF